MDRLQALRLVAELYSEKPLGVDAAGDQVSEPRNSHFLACARCVVPDFPRESNIKPWAEDPANISEYDRQARAKLARFFQDLAVGLTASPSSAETLAAVEGLPF